MWSPSAPGVQIFAGRSIPAVKTPGMNTTLGAIVEAIASRNRLEASVAPSLAGIKIPHIDQSQESDAKFLTRLAERNGGEVSVKMGKLLFLKAGQGVTASGKKIPQVTITRRRRRPPSFCDC
ncbi:phage protein D [Escherichia coli]|nr:phage protein D [Escherichia coli]